MDVADALLLRFRGREDVLAIGQGDGFAPYHLKDGERIEPEWLRLEHLSQRRCLGFYLMRPDNTVLCSCLDFDNKEADPDPQWKAKAEKIYYELCRAGLYPTIELSQSGQAAHVWLFCEEPIPAYLIREMWRCLGREYDIPLREIYPRQDELDTEKGLGNLVRYPLWRQSKFVDVEADWAEADPLKVLQSAQTISRFEVTDLTARLGGETKKPTGEEAKVTGRVWRLVADPHTLLGRRWRGDMGGLSDPTRSALCLSICCELVRQYVPTAEIEAALREWCVANDYSKGRRDKWVTTTVEKAYGFVLDRTETKSQHIVTLKDAAASYISAIENGEIYHLGTGIAQVDASIEGVAPGEVCVVAAQTGHGKTAFTLQWLQHIGALGIPTLLISEEMSARELGKRALSRLGAKKETIQESPHSVRELSASLEMGAPVYIVENVGTVTRCEEVLQQFVRHHGVGFVAVDYLQLLGGGKLAASRYELVTEVSRKLKQCAQRLSVPLVALSQLNREIERREDITPKLSDLRESGGIAQDADLIIFLQWPWRIDSTVDPHVYYFYFAKRRNGAIRSPRVGVHFDADRQTLGEPNRRKEFDEWNLGN